MTGLYTFKVNIVECGIPGHIIWLGYSYAQIAA